MECLLHTENEIIRVVFLVLKKKKKKEEYLLGKVSAELRKKWADPIGRFRAEAPAFSPTAPGLS